MTVLIVSIALAIAIWGVIILVKILRPGKPAFSSEELIKVFGDIGGLKTTIQTMEGGQRDLSSSLKEAQRTIDAIKTDYDSRKTFFEQLRNSVRTMEDTISGTKRRGEAGENILQEILSSFPANMIIRNFRIGGKEVEFGLVLSNDKIVPIDSKWAAQELLKQLALEEDNNNRAALVNKIENEISKRTDEVVQYIDPTRTVPWAIAAIPDAAFSVCKKAHLEAYKKGVILLPYCLTLPYLLTVFNLHLQYAGSLDLENIQEHIINIKRHIERMEAILENSIIRSATMINNAANDYRQTLGSLRGAITSLQTSSPNKEKALL